jgi:hypothetical protein
VKRTPFDILAIDKKNPRNIGSKFLEMLYSWTIHGILGSPGNRNAYRDVKAFVRA